jgi:hypothetical protein
MSKLSTVKRIKLENLYWRRCRHAERTSDKVLFIVFSHLADDVSVAVFDIELVSTSWFPASWILRIPNRKAQHCSSGYTTSATVEGQVWCFDYVLYDSAVNLATEALAAGALVALERRICFCWVHDEELVAAGQWYRGLK